MADLIACAQTMNFSGKADPSTWTSAIKALTDNRFWDVKSISQGFHVFGPLEPDEDKKIAALPPESRPGPVASGSIEIDWRRQDGKRKYLYDLIGAQMPKLYADLEAVLHLRETACTASKPQ
jgi:hypothetical protein